MFEKFSLTLTLVLVSLSIGVSHAISAYSDPHFVGDRKVIVQLMEWKFEEIAKECELFLGPYGYGGVQLSPIGEYAVIDRRPWWERYQPVGYKIVSRSGNEQQFKNMVDRCNKVGVRIYVDVVLNHMTGLQSGGGTANDTYDGNSENYPGVPFTSADFHGHESCPTADLNIANYDDPNQCRNCQLGGLRDLKQDRENVRAAQAQFLNKMIDAGVAGFRSDASKHQWPADLENIISRLHPLNTQYFPSNSHPFWYHEVITGTIKPDEYFSIGRVIEFKYFDNIGRVFRKLGNQRLAYLKNFANGWGMMNDQDALVMIDSHDIQRGHTGDLSVSIAYFDAKLLKMSTAFMLALPYAVTRVMSSYYWPRTIKDNKDINDWMGPPMYANQTILDVKRNDDLTCGKEWICEHRWPQIYKMAKFRNVVADSKMTNWWDNTFNSIAFSRENKGFIAINNDIQPINQKLPTGLPAGNYCDIISGNLVAGKCSGRSITVGSDGTAQIFVDNSWEDPIIAFHIESKV